MSIKAIQIVMDESKQKGSTLLLLIILANFAHDDGTYAFPSVATMARYTRLTKRNVYLLLRKLQDAGELAEMGLHNSGTVIYRLVLPGFKEQREKFSSPKGTGVKRGSSRGEAGIRGGVIAPSPDPSSNPNEPSGDRHSLARLSGSVSKRTPGRR